MNWADERYTPGGPAFDKNSVDILDVLVKIGGRVGYARGHGWWDDEVPVWCPFCEDQSSRKPAGRANTTKQVYHCWACGFGGDVITIAKKHLGFAGPGSHAYSAAVKWLEEEVVGSAQ